METNEEKLYQLVIVGGGPAGMAAALSAWRSGIKDILLIERDRCLGGILNQCIHNGFGLHHFKEDLTGPEYAGRFIEDVVSERIPYVLNTMVVHITRDKELVLVNEDKGVFKIRARAIILAMGSRERTRGAISIPGTRPAGVITAGTAQRLTNLEGYNPGNEIVILGSGDIGLIMARRMTLEGSTVKAVCEIEAHSSGLSRNIAQCLDDFDIPLLLNHTVTAVYGQDRVTAVDICSVDDKKRPILESKRTITCDCFMLSVGLIPENERSIEMGVSIDHRTKGPVVDDRLETSVQGVFSCGNVLHIHDLVDSVSSEAFRAGEQAARYLGEGKSEKSARVSIKAGNGISYTIPQYLLVEEPSKKVLLQFRVGSSYRNVTVSIVVNNKEVYALKKRVLNPGEMASLIVDREHLALSPDDEVVLEVVE